MPAGHIPGIDEAKQRLAHLEEHGPTQFAFTFRGVVPPDENFLASFDWSVFRACPADVGRASARLSHGRASGAPAPAHERGGLKPALRCRVETGSSRMLPV